MPKMEITSMRAGQLTGLATPFDVKFASGWKTVAKAEPTRTRGNQPVVKLLDEQGRLIASFFADSEVRVNRQVAK